MGNISRKSFFLRKPLTACAAVAVFSFGSKAQSIEQPYPSYKVSVVPLAPGASTMSWPMAFNNAGQMVTSSYLNGQNYGFQISRYGSDGLKDIGLLRNDSHRGTFSINNLGQVAGRLNFGTEYYDTRAISFDGQSTLDLGTLGGTRSYSTALNDAGQVVGTSETGVGYDRRAFLSGGGAAMQGLNVGGNSSEASGINNSGDIVGSYDTATNPTYGELHAYAIRNGVFSDLGKLTGSESYATAINDAGQIIGGVRFPDYSSHAFRHQNGAMTDLGTLGGTSSQASDINASGVVVGQSQTSIPGVWNSPANHAFLYGNDGVMRDLGALGDNSQDSHAVDINDNGQIVGWAYQAGGVQRGFVYRDGQMYDLNGLVNYQLGWTISGAEFINNSGQIAATGRDANGNTRALLLTPNTRPVAVNDTATVAQDSIDNVIRVLDNDTDADNDPLTLTEYLWAPNGQVRRSDNNTTITYTPNAGFVGSDTIHYNVSDGSATTESQVNVTVTPNNNGLLADVQSIETDEDTAKTILLTAQAPSGQTIDSYLVTTQPIHGQLTGTAPNLTYTPAANYYGADSFAFRAFSGTSGSNIANVDIAVKPINDAPVASPQNLTTAEDTSKYIILAATDVDGDALTYSIVSQPTKGVLTETAPRIFYNPGRNYYGSDSFSFKVNDGNLDSAPSVISITVTPVNDLPVAVADTFTIDEDSPTTSLDVLANDTDIEGDSLTIYSLSYESGPLAGPGTFQRSADRKTMLFTPKPNFNGTATFQYAIVDAQAPFSDIWVRSQVIVRPVNDAPTSSTQSVTTNEDTAKNITLAASDIDGDVLTYSIVAAPTKGTLSGSGATRTYTPNADFSGTDSFTFKANDGTVDSNISTVNISVTPVNDAPIADAQTVSTDEDTTKNITLSGFDAEGSPLTYTVVSNPTRGTLSGVAPNLIYTPNANLNGADSFTFKVNDGVLNSPTATVSISVKPVNDTPVATNININVNEDSGSTYTLLASDADNNVLTYSIVTPPAHGTASVVGSSSSVNYQPALNYNGADSFTFKVNDGTVDSNVATVNITVKPVNDAPVVAPQTLSTQEDTALPITLSGSDIENDALTFFFQQPAHGTLSGTAPNLVYTPSANYNGTDSFLCRADDGYYGSNIASVTISVTPVEDAPVATSRNYTISEDGGLGIQLTGTDADGDTVTCAIVTRPTNGNLSGTPSNLVYTPNANFNGTDSFTFTANDGKADSAPATIGITITPTNDAPVSSTQSVTTNQNTAKNITLAATDIDGDALTYSVVTPPTKGTLSGTAPSLIYTPNLNSIGSDSFTFKANDGNTNSNTATVSITVNAVNSAPVASTQNVTTNEDTTKNITLAATDIDGDALTYSIVTSPTKGTLSGSGANRVYTPNADSNGTDSFTFKANDGTVDSNISTVNITVTPTNDAPVSSTQSVTTNEDTAKNITLAATDIDGDALTYSVVTAPTKGILSGSGANRVYTPNANFNGTDSFSFKANDGIIDSNAATVSISITAVNDAPIAVNDTASTPKNASKLIAVLANDTDVDGDTLAIASVTAGANGTVAISGTSVNFTPARNFIGNASFSYVVKDNKGGTATATVAVTVTR